MKKCLVLSACLLLCFGSSCFAENDSAFLGGFEAACSYDALAIAGVSDNSRSLSLTLSGKAFTVPLAGISYSCGLALESNIVNMGYLLELGAAFPISLGNRFYFEPGAFLSGGYRYAGYPIAHGLFYGAASAELPIRFAFSECFSLRFGIRASLYYLHGHHITHYQEQTVITDVEPELVPAFPLLVGCRFSL